MSEVKPLILGLCSMNSFEIGEKKQRREKKKMKYFFAMNKHVDSPDMCFI